MTGFSARFSASARPWLSRKRLRYSNANVLSKPSAVCRRVERKCRAHNTSASTTGNAAVMSSTTFLLSATRLRSVGTKSRKTAPLSGSRPRTTTVSPRPW
jgi:hypothetical protein